MNLDLLDKLLMRDEDALTNMMFVFYLISSFHNIAPFVVVQRKIFLSRLSH